MNTLANGISYFDVEFLGTPRVIATALLVGRSDVAIVDPGPTTSLTGLMRGLEAAGLTLQDVTTILVTHIHLDHSGGVGLLVRQNPRLRVYVHRKGAPHLADPQKLVSSAARLYGDDMDRLWGDVQPVPEANLTILDGGERIQA